MLKILHTADVHLGIKFPGLGNKGDVQRRQIEETFKKIISLAIAEKVNILLIAGDLFDSNQQTQKIIDLVIYQFNLLGKNNIPVCLIPGNHDCLDATSIYRKINFANQCPNLTIFTDSKMGYHHYPEMNLTVYGKPNLSEKSTVSPLQGLKRITDSQYHVALAHGSFFIPEKVAADDHIFTGAEIAESGMNYIALGHWHNAGKYTSGTVSAYYSGAPEWLDFKQDGPGKIIQVNITDNCTVEVQERVVGLRHSDLLEINMGEIANWQDLENKITYGADVNLARTVNLKGLRSDSLTFNPDSIDELQDSLGTAFFNLRIEDNSAIPVADIAPDAYAGKPIIARFIELTKNRIAEASDNEEKKIAEDALQYGIALLEDRVKL